MRGAPVIRRLLDDTLVAGLVILAIAAIVLGVTARAQNGFPWQRHHMVTVAVPDAGKLTKNADVRIGGARVGQVLDIRAMPRKGDRPPHAQLEVQLEPEAGPLPADTTAEVRVSSVLGGKFVALVPGDGRRTVGDGGHLPLSNAVPGMDIDDALRIFDPEGRRATRKVIRELGDALAGRGGDLNETFAVTVDLLPVTQRVLENLNASATDLPGFIDGAAAATAALRPVAREIGPLTREASATLEALDAAGGALGETIREVPVTARTTQAALRGIQPVLDDAAAIADDLRPAARSLRPSTERLDTLLRTAIRVGPESATIDAPLAQVLDAVGGFTGNPASAGSLRLLGGTDLATFGASAFVGLGAILETTWEAELHCRVVSDWVAGLSEILSDGDEGGNWIRMIPVFEREEMFPSAEPAPNLHANPYPRQDATECESGNEPYLPGRQIGNPPGRQGGAR